MSVEHYSTIIIPLVQVLFLSKCLDSGYLVRANCPTILPNVMIILSN